MTFVFELGFAPKCAGDGENILDSVFNSTWTSSPITVSKCMISTPYKFSYSLCKLHFVSYWKATRYNVFSSNGLPINCKPIGRPFALPQGIDIPGKPAKLTGVTYIKCSCWCCWSYYNIIVIKNTIEIIFN